jgi:hydrogenase maturation protein HypF
LKNTVCLTKANKAFLSQHIGDLENLATYGFLGATVEHLKRLLDIDPEFIAHDLHPDYLSTKYAQKQPDVPKVPVQHHHAHIVSCMAEHNLDGPVIGLSLDGSGYGTDGRVWGGEVLFAEAANFRRAAHLFYVPMPGGAAAIREPWRMGLSYLYQSFGQRLWDLDLPILKSIERGKIDVILGMVSKGVNAPETSSLGRLFDGVAAIVGIRNRAGFEGQAAMELEMLAEGKRESIYDYDWSSGEVTEVLTDPITRGVVRDIQRGIPPSCISRKFHDTLIHLFAELCDALRKESGLNRVVLSGGVFQNAILLCGLTRALEQRNFQVFSHQKVPTNDGGISLGQAVAAAAAVEAGNLRDQRIVQ